MLDYITKNKQQIRFAIPSQDQTTLGAEDVVSWPAKNLVDFNVKPADISCAKKEKYLMVFKGADDYPTRKQLGKLDNNKDIRIILPTNRDHCSNCGSGEYKELLTNTMFGAVVRGDTFYSYRFLEVMSAGVVPVIYSDKWLLPFYEVRK